MIPNPQVTQSKDSAGNVNSSASITLDTRLESTTCCFLIRRMGHGVGDTSSCEERKKAMIQDGRWQAMTPAEQAGITPVPTSWPKKRMDF